MRSVRNQIVRRIEEDQIDTVVSLMPHVLDPIIAPAIRATGAKLVSIIHDATSHPGDRTSRMASRLFCDAKHADAVVTLSNHVSSSLLAQSAIEFQQSAHAVSSEPWLRRLLEAGAAPAIGSASACCLLGRILSYKGLDLLIDAVEILRDRGYAVELGASAKACSARTNDALMRSARRCVTSG